VGTAETLHFCGRNDTPVRGIPLDAHLPVAVPAPQRVDADAERASGLGG
jgi:hypothetical protein